MLTYLEVSGPLAVPVPIGEMMIFRQKQCTQEYQEGEKDELSLVRTLD